MSIKDINLDRSKIEPLLTQYATTALENENAVVVSYGPLRADRPDHVECRMKLDGGDALVHFYFKDNGTTTIQYKVGKRPDISQKIAEHVAQHGVRDHKQNFMRSFRNVSEAQVKELHQLLEKYGATLHSESPKEYSSVWRYRGHYDDSVTVTHFPTTSTLTIQGRPLPLLYEVVAILSGTLSLDSFLGNEQTGTDTKVDVRDIRNDLRERLPTVYDFLGETLLKMLSSSLMLKKVQIEAEDYSFYAYPALRCLEGYIKKLFLEKGITVGQAGFGDYFDRPSVTGRFKLTEACRTHFACEKTCTAIEICYSYLNSQRHRLFHADELPDTSRIIEDKNVAIGIVDQVVQYMEKSYSSLR